MQLDKHIVVVAIAIRNECIVQNKVIMPQKMSEPLTFPCWCSFNGPLFKQTKPQLGIVYWGHLMSVTQGWEGCRRGTRTGGR